MADASVYAGSPNANYGTVSGAVVGEASGEWRSYSKWDIAGTALLQGATITNVTLHLYRNTATGVNTIYVRKVNSPWTEGAITWNNKPGTTFFDTSNFSIPGIPGAIDLIGYSPLVSWVQGVLNGTISDYGLALESGVQTGVYDTFGSRESGTTYVAKLIIYYTPAPLLGSVKGNILPMAAQSAGARWRLTSGSDTAWKTDGTILTNVSPGNYTMTFSNLSGWLVPSSTNFSVVANQQSSITGTYTQYTTLTVLLTNLSGSSYGAQKTRTILSTTPPQTNTANPATFTTLLPSTYLLSGYQQATNPATPFGEELWWQQSLLLSGGTSNVTMVRNLPYVSSIVFSNVAAGSIIGSADFVPGADLVRAYITVKNNASTLFSCRTRLLLTLNTNSVNPSFDSGLTGTQSATSSGGTTTFTIDFSPAGLTVGPYWFAVEVQSHLSGSDVRTDGWAWTRTFSSYRVAQLYGFVVAQPYLHSSIETNPVSLLRQGGGTIDPALRTWIIIHGRGASRGAAYIQRLANAVLTNRAGEQVLTLDWSTSASPGNTADTTEEDWIPVVGAWTASKLAAYGFTGTNLNLMGHSWGGNITSELADRVAGGVDTIVALDPAHDGDGSYNPDLNHGSGSAQVHFVRSSRFSWCFHSSLYGSGYSPATADETFNVYTYGSEIAAMHVGVVDAFSFMVEHPTYSTTNTVSQYFTLQRLLSHTAGSWWIFDQYPILFTLDGIVLAAEGNIYCNENQNMTPIDILFSDNGDNSGPTIQVTSHVDYQAVATKVVILTGIATDHNRGDNGINTVTMDGTLLAIPATGADATAAWTNSVAVSAGTNTFTIIARDNSAAHNATTNIIHLVYDPTPPSVVVTSPVNGYRTSASFLLIFGTASDAGLGNSGISSVTVNGVAVQGGTSIGSATAYWTNTASLSVGTNLLSIVAKDGGLTHNSVTQQFAIVRGLAPSISPGLTNLVVLLGQPVTLSIGAAGTQPLTYRWYKNGSLTWSTTNYMTLTPTIKGDTATYTVTVSNEFDVASSGPAKLTIAVVSRLTQPTLVNSTTLRLEFQPADGTSFTAADSTGYTLEASDPLGSVWTRIPASFQVVAGRIRADIAISSSVGKKFYRLVKP